MSKPVRKIKNITRRKTRKKPNGINVKHIRLFLLASGIILLVSGIFFPGNNTEKAESPDKSDREVVSFSEEPVRIDEALISEKPSLFNAKNRKAEVKNPPVKVVVPALGIDLKVKEANPVKGYWEVFTDSAGWGKGSSYPQDGGNTVIFAHARDGLFAPLKTAKIGMSIYIHTTDRWFEYKINEIREVLPSQIEVIAPTDDATLTLYTCTGFSDSKRLIIIGKKP